MDNLTMPVNNSLKATSFFIKRQLVVSGDPKLDAMIDILLKPREYRLQEDLALLVPFVKELNFFKQRKMQHQDITNLCMEMTYESRKKGEAVFKFGDFGNKFFIILKGKVDIMVPDPNFKQQKPMKNAISSTSNHTYLTQSVPATVFNPQGTSRPTSSGQLNAQMGKKPSSTDTSIVSSPMNTFKQLSGVAKRRPSMLSSQIFISNQKLNKKNQNTSQMSIDQAKISEEDDADLTREKSNRSKPSHPQSRQSSLESDVVSQEKRKTLSKSPSRLINSLQFTLKQVTQDSLDSQSLTDEDDDTGFFKVASLTDGQPFGELALIQNKPRMATVRCCAPVTHMMVLTKESFDDIIGKMEKRTLNDKINHLSNISVFSLLTKNSLAKLTYSMTKVKFLKGAYLYREGDSVRSVFFVIKGEFQVRKTLVIKKEIEENTQKIFKDPLKASKNADRYFFKNNHHSKMVINLFIIGPGQMIGEEDVVSGAKHYQSSVICHSQEADVYEIKFDEFLKVQKLGPNAWRQLEKDVQDKFKKIDRLLISSSYSQHKLQIQIQKEAQNYKSRSHLKHEIITDETFEDANVLERNYRIPERAIDKLITMRESLAQSHKNSQKAISPAPSSLMQSILQPSSILKPPKLSIKEDFITDKPPLNNAIASSKILFDTSLKQRAQTSQEQFRANSKTLLTSAEKSKKMLTKFILKPIAPMPRQKSPELLMIEQRLHTQQNQGISKQLPLASLFQKRQGTPNDNSRNSGTKAAPLSLHSEYLNSHLKQMFSRGQTPFSQILKLTPTNGEAKSFFNTRNCNPRSTMTAGPPQSLFNNTDLVGIHNRRVGLQSQQL